MIGASAALVRAVASGEVTPLEAGQLARLVEVHVRAIEIHELHERIAGLEADAANSQIMLSATFGSISRSTS